MTSASVGLPREASTIVVGAGMAGLELAAVLDRAGCPALVLEAGPARELRHANMDHGPNAALRLWLDPSTDDYFHRPWTSLSSPHFEGASGLRRRLGGRSLYWYGVALEIEPWALSEPWWPDSVVRDLRDCWRGGASLYSRIDQQLRHWRGDADGPLADPRAQVHLGDLVLEQAPLAIRRDRTDPQRWYAYSPLDAWRDPVTGRVKAWPEHVDLRCEAEVLRVVVGRRGVEGVLVRGRTDDDPLLVGAARVVLAAGTVENARLGLQALSDAGSLDEPHLGGLMDHIVQGVFLRLEGSQAARLGSVVAPGTYVMCCGPPTRSNVFLELRPLDDGALLVDLQATGEQLPSEASYVTCTVAAADARWDTQVHVGLVADDEVVLTEQRTMLQRTFDALASVAGCPTATLTFADYDRPERTNAYVLSDSLSGTTAGTPATWSGQLGTEDHEGGTLALGDVLGEDHEFVAVPGLFAAGPATFPRLGAANPSMTTLALAHRLGSRLSDRD